MSVVIMFEWTLFNRMFYFGDNSVKLEQQLKGLLDQLSIDSSDGEEEMIFECEKCSRRNCIKCTELANY